MSTSPEKEMKRLQRDIFRRHNFKTNNVNIAMYVQFLAMYAHFLYVRPIFVTLPPGISPITVNNNKKKTSVVFSP
jgi:hypothetical protein